MANRVDPPDPVAHDRGQTYIIEGLLALLLISGVLFAFAPGILFDPAAESPAEAARETQIEKDTEAVLEASVTDGSAVATLLEWDTEDQEYDDGQTPAVSTTGAFIGYPETKFGARLEQLGNRHNASINVYATPVYRNTSAAETPPVNQSPGRPVIVTGSPSGTSIIASETVVIHDGDPLQANPDRFSYETPAPQRQARNQETIRDAAANNEAPFQSGDGELSDGTYNLVRIDVVIWYEV